MPLHIFYSPDNISSTSMTRASVSSLVQSSGQRWLWVHAVLVWWMTLTWLATALWIIWGGLAYRKREVRRLAERTRQSREKLREQQGGEVGAGPAGQSEAWSVGDECEGIKRFRTVMITNVPPDSECGARTTRLSLTQHQCATRRRSGTILTTTYTDIA